jgi:hypothetical protein
LLFPQVAFGGIYFFVALATFVGMIAEGSTDTSLGLAAATLVFYLLASSLWITIGVLGLIATWNLQAIMSLSHVAVSQAERYWKANLFCFAIISFFTLVGLITSTVAVAGGEKLVDGEILERTAGQQVLVIIWVWLVGGFSVLAQAYFLYVVWSYKHKLAAAYAGRPFGTFVIKNRSPLPLVSINGAAPAGAPMVPMTHKHPGNMYEKHSSPAISSRQHVPTFVNVEL